MTRRLALIAVLALVVAACTDDSEESIAETEPTVTTTRAASPEPTTPGIPPDIDMGRHSVPLEDIHFDTFDGGSVPLSESTPQLRARLLDAIPPIDDPVYGDASAGDWLEPNDLVMGFVGDDQTYAYPFKILNFHEIVNDEIDGVPLLISYCPLCRSAIVYERRVGDEVLSFGNTSALYESDLVMVDRNTGSYWWQVAGRAIVGPLTDTELTPLASVVSTWENWKQVHPDTLILTRETGFERPYEQSSFAGYEDFIDSGSFPFPVGDTARDPRLAASELVVGVDIDGEVVAYPVDSLDGPRNDRVGGVPIVVLPTEGGAAVFDRRLGDRVLEFRMLEGELVDGATGSAWSAEGVATSGEWLGRTLTPVPARTTFWFAFVGAFPDVEVRG